MEPYLAEPYLARLRLEAVPLASSHYAAPVQQDASLVVGVFLAEIHEVDAHFPRAAWGARRTK